MSGMAEVDILVKHVLLTSRNGFAACAAEGCPWEDRFYRGDKYGEVPLHVRAAHADHQMELLTAAGFGPVKEAAAEALEEAADDSTLRLSGNSGISITKLRARAAALRGES